MDVHTCTVRRIVIITTGAYFLLSKLHYNKVSDPVTFANSFYNLCDQI